MQTTFRAKWTTDIFRNDNFAVALFHDGERTYKCIGPMVPSVKNVYYDIVAEESKDEKYGGMKYTITSVAISKCDGKKEIIDFLSSGLFPGIGKKMAEKIYAKFGEQSVEIVKNMPEKLTAVKGISSAKIGNIIRNYKHNKAETEAFEYLQKFGFTVRQVHDIRQENPTDDLIDYVKSNPYSMISVRGVTFDMADKVAIDNLVPRDDIARVEAAAIQIIKNYMVAGHVGCEYLPVAKELIKLLNTERVNASTVNKYILELIKRDKIDYRKVMIDGKEVLYLYLFSALEAENELTDCIKKCLESNTAPEIKELNFKIKKISTDQGIRLDQSQYNAVKTALCNNLTVITGGPGTGKTTIINTIAEVWDKYVKKDVVLMSPTGRAARRMSEATGRHAATIHSTLRFGISDSFGIRNEMSEENYIEDSLVIIDEASMIDQFLARDTLKHLKKCVIVFVGDADQLPSVGCGKVLEDLISSHKIPVAKLEYSHRQDDGSTICENAYKIKNGNCNIKAAPDFSIMVSKADPHDYNFPLMEKVEEKMISEYTRLVDRFGLENVAVLCPFNKHSAGQLSLNKKLQQIMNPCNGRKEFKGKNGEVFRAGDPVMQLINDEDVSNGDVGTVMTIDRVDGREVLIVKYYDCLKTYTKDNSENITLAYAMTVHKSQGSEYDAVVTCLTDAHGSMIRRNILYTAITRAKKYVSFVGTETALKNAILNDKVEPRNTLLSYNLRQKIAGNDKVIEYEGYQQMRMNL